MLGMKNILWLTNVKWLTYLMLKVQMSTGRKLPVNFSIYFFMTLFIQFIVLGATVKGSLVVYKMNKFQSFVSSSIYINQFNYINKEFLIKVIKGNTRLQVQGTTSKILTNIQSIAIILLYILWPDLPVYYIIHIYISRIQQGY